MRPLRRLAVAAGRRKWLLLALFVAAAAVVAAEGPGPALEWIGRRSLLELAVVGLVSLFGLSWRREARTTRILPFRNLTGDDDLDAMAQAFPELLELEVRRVTKLSSEGTPFEQESVNVAAMSRGVAPGVERRQVLETASGTSGQSSLADIGTVDVAGVRLQLGAMLRSLSRSPTIAGSVIRLGDDLRFVADHSGSRRGKWTVAVRWLPGDDPTAAVEAAARELAQRICWEARGQQAADANWRSFARLVEGLENYDRYLEDRRLANLRQAEDCFLDAIAISPQFAAAYQNLGVVHEERFRAFRAQDRPEWREEVRRAADSYRLAASIDPLMTSAHVNAAVMLSEQAEFDLAVDPEAVVTAGRRAVSVGRHQGMPCPSAYYWLGQFLMKWAPYGAEPAKARRREAIRAYRAAERDYRWLRRTRRLPVEAGAGLKPIQSGLAHCLAARGDCHAELKQYRRACSAFGDAIHLGSASPIVHARLGWCLFKRRRWAGAWNELTEALRLDPRLDIAAWWLGQWSERRSRDDAKALYRYALTVNPTNFDLWMGQAEAQETADPETAMALAGVALALAPRALDAYQLLARLHGRAPSTIARRAAAAYEEVATQLAGGSRLDPADDPPEGLEPERVDVRLRVRRWCRGWLTAQDAPAEAVDMLEPGPGLPEEALVDHELGRIHRAAGNTERAVERFRRAVDGPAALSMPGVHLTWMVDLADAQAESGDQALFRGDTEAAASRYREAVDNYSTALAAMGALGTIVSSPPSPGPVGGAASLRLDAAAPGTRARAVAGRGGARKALAEADPDAPDADIDVAISDCEEAIQLEPTYPYPHDLLAQLFRRRGNLDLAVETWERVRALAPAAAAVVAWRIGDVQRSRVAGVQNRAQRGRWLEKAAASYRQALFEDIGDIGGKEAEASVHRALGETLLDLGKADEAVTELEQAAGQEAPEAPEVLIALARAYQLAGRLSDAEDRYRDAIDGRTAAYRRAVAEERPPDEVRAAAWALSAAQGWLAYFHAVQGDDLEEGRKLVAEALGLLQEFPIDDEPARLRDTAALLDTRGWLHYREGDWDRAICDLQESLRMDIHIDIRHHLALAYEARADDADDDARRRRDLLFAKWQWDHIREMDPARVPSGGPAAAPVASAAVAQ